MEHIGIDLGSRESQVCVRNDIGEDVEEKRSRTSGEYRLGLPMDSILLRNPWFDELAGVEIDEATAKLLCAGTEISD